MTPRRRPVRLALSALFVVHLLLVVDSVAGPYLPFSKAWTQSTQTGQSWNMFGNPRPTGWGLELYGVDADGERVLLMPSAARVEDTVHVLYDRKVKVQQNLAKKSGRHHRKHLAAWACREYPELTGVELDVLRFKRPTMAQYGTADAPFTLDVIKTAEFPCP